MVNSLCTSPRRWGLLTSPSPTESPQWDGELELGSDDDEERDNADSADKNVDDGLTDYLNRVNDSPLWVLVRDFLTPAGILVMRTTGPKWNHAKFFGSFAALWFFLMEKDESEKDESDPFPEWYAVLFGRFGLFRTISGVGAYFWLFLCCFSVFFVFLASSSLLF